MPKLSLGRKNVARNAIGLWFCGIAVIGFSRFFGKAFGDAGFQPTLVAWLWLAGSIVLAVSGLAIILHGIRSKPSARR